MEMCAGEGGFQLGLEGAYSSTPNGVDHQKREIALITLKLALSRL
jgi:hypothetical protein